MARTKADSGSLSRREFLGATATVTLSTGNLLRTVRAHDASPSTPWYSVMRRCGQINVNERDPLTLDAEAWMDYWASLKVDAVLLNGGGILAFYPTRVPFHHRSQYLGSRDLFGEMVAAIHRDNGVDLRTGVTVTDVFGESRIAGVALSDGSRIEADVVVVGIGVTPNTEWLEGSGLTLDNGIVCDGSGEAAPHVYAAGDVARVANRWHGESPRIEHWTNAVEQAVHAAENALAGPSANTTFSSVPYFWSDQYDRKIQFIGRARPHDEMVIVDGSLADRRLTALYRRGDRVVACLAVNQPLALLKYRKVIAGGALWEAALSGTGV